MHSDASRVRLLLCKMMSATISSFYTTILVLNKVTLTVGFFLTVGSPLTVKTPLTVEYTLTVESPMTVESPLDCDLNYDLCGWDMGIPMTSS